MPQGRVGRRIEAAIGDALAAAGCAATRSTLSPRSDAKAASAGIVAAAEALGVPLVRRAARPTSKPLEPARKPGPSASSR